MAFVPPSLTGGLSGADSGLNIAPLYFGSYSASPITGSGNTAAGGAVSAVPQWLWLVAIGGAFLLAKRRGA
ncbi:MAG: hypothetical protein KBT88_03510 [Gammaproteobacteria bacterium]|nr:hypothetical protein [Gammaproteobacteria bacterium]MBQ0838828.1 hypothetical protein [Gammaproteobacteria bacterium]